MSRRLRRRREIWAGPLAVFALSLAGLLAALLVDGVADVPAVAAVASSLVAIVWALGRRRGGG
jgi:hypothetical protein